MTGLEYEARPARAKASAWRMISRDEARTAPQAESPETHGTLPGKYFPSTLRHVRFAALPPRYGVIALGSALLIIGSAACVPLGPQASTPGRELLAVLSAAGGLALVFGASLCARAPARWRRWYARSRHIVLVAAMLLALGTVLTSAGAAYLTLHAPAAQSYVTDIVSFTHVNAELVLAGRNPYTSDDAFTSALIRFPLAAGTPLRGEVFGTGLDLPAPGRILDVQQEYVHNPDAFAGAFDPRTLHSYPALSFLAYVPLLWAGLGNVLFLDAAVYWLLLAWLIWLAPVGWRHWAALIGVAAMPVMAASLMESTDIVGIALVLLAWHIRDRRWLSSGLFGLALAYKQLAWFFIPFFVLEVLFTYGWRDVAKRGALVAGAFLLPNLPYVIASPQAWFESLWLPMSEPLFATGMGIVALSIGHIVPYAPPLVYALLELAALGMALWAYARWRAYIGDGVLILALLPLFFALRSAPTYFAFTPWLALYAVNRFYAQRMMPQPSPVVDVAARAVGRLRAVGVTAQSRLARHLKAARAMADASPLGDCVLWSGFHDASTNRMNGQPADDVFLQYARVIYGAARARCRGRLSRVTPGRRRGERDGCLDAQRAGRAAPAGTGCASRCTGRGVRSAERGRCIRSQAQ